MKRKIIKIILVLTIFLLPLSFYGCIVNYGGSYVSIEMEGVEKVFVTGERISFGSFFGDSFMSYVSSDSKVIKIEGSYGYCLEPGNVVIRAYNKINGSLVDEYFVRVVLDEITDIELEASSVMAEGETQTLKVSVTPQSTTKKVVFVSNDEGIASVSSNGVVSALSSGLVTIKCYSEEDETIFQDVSIFIKENSIDIEKIEEQVGTKEKETLESASGSVFSSLISSTSQSIVGVSSYSRNIRTGAISLSANASGVVYKRVYVLNNGDIVDSVNPGEEFKSYRYFVITNKSLVEKKYSVYVSYNSRDYLANVIASDSKIDISVLSFDCSFYIPVITLGDSDIIETGEFIISVGKTYEGTVETTGTFGVISYASRYVTTASKDWDALYIQHDSGISSYSTGGALINMRGEVIGINSVYINSNEIDNMAFAIPINLVMKIVSQLEQGIIPSRPTLGITILTVKDIINKELTGSYPIPDGLEYGMFVTQVTSGGVAKAAGVKAGDIILEVKGMKLTYSYELRAILNEVIIGSNQEVIIKVIRNGEEVELKAVF